METIAHRWPLVNSLRYAPAALNVLVCVVLAPGAQNVLHVGPATNLSLEVVPEH